MHLRPKVTFLSNELIERIIAEARDILCKLGTTIHNKNILSLLADHGGTVDMEKSHATYTNDMIDKALKLSPSSFALYDVMGKQTHDFSGFNVHYTPGTAAIHVLDSATQKARKPTTEDYVKFVKIANQCQHIASQSTSFIPADVHEKISDSYRLYLSLLFGEKPVVTGAFTIEAFEIMKDLQLIVRGGEKELREKPLTIFSVCPTSPLKWSDITSQNLLDCGRYGIPVEFISMPLSGFMAPVTLTGTLVAHTAETLSGVVISQLSHPGTPMLYGGSPAIFDVRYETTPMGAVETQMVDCAYNEIGKYLGFPTQAYISLSDAKMLDAQAGLETSMGATLAALSGINNISGPGMLDFESCISLEKLILDNEICGMTQRMIAGIQPKDDFPSLPIFQELLKDRHLLIFKHTRKYIKEEHYFPGPVIDRANLSRWQEEGGLTLIDRAQLEIKKILANHQDTPLSREIKSELTQRMTSEANKYNMQKLPDISE